MLLHCKINSDGTHLIFTYINPKIFYHISTLVSNLVISKYNHKQRFIQKFKSSKVIDVTTVPNGNIGKYRIPLHQSFFCPPCHRISLYLVVKILNEKGTQRQCYTQCLKLKLIKKKVFKFRHNPWGWVYKTLHVMHHYTSFFSVKI